MYHCPNHFKWKCFAENSTSFRDYVVALRQSEGTVEIQRSYTRVTDDIMNKTIAQSVHELEDHIIEECRNKAK